MQVLLIHGWGGPSEEHWQSWLEKELMKKRIKSFYPTLPNSERPKEEEWIKTLKKQGMKLNDQAVVVGFSLGVPAALRFIETFKENEKIGKLISVSGFGRSIRIPELENFFKKDFNWKKIKEKTKERIVIYSDNDPYVPITDSKYLIKQLDADGILEHEAGHINVGSGHTSYPKVLELIMSD